MEAKKHEIQLSEGGKLFLHVITIAPEENTGFEIIDVPKAQKSNVLVRKYYDSERHAFIINGGYFDTHFAPVGYYKVNGEVISSTVAPKLSGFVTIDPNGAIDLLWKNKGDADLPYVMQTGPYIIDPGGKMGIRSSYGNPTKRNLISKEKDGTIRIITTSAIRLYELAEELLKLYPNIDRALNMDGGPSVSLIYKDVEITNRGPVRNFIVKTKQYAAPIELIER